MKVMAVYIFRSEGLPLLSRFYHERAQKIDGLVAPFLVSTSNRMEELTGANIQEMALDDNLHLIMENFAGIICAVVVSDKKDTNLQLSLVARRFYKRYHKSLQKWTGKLDQFDEFIPELEGLLEIESDVVISRMPSQILDSFIMSDFTKEEQEVLKMLIKQSEMSRQQITAILGQDESSSNLINKLLNQNLVGVKTRKSGETLYFVFD